MAWKSRIPNHLLLCRETRVLRHPCCRERALERLDFSSAFSIIYGSGVCVFCCQSTVFSRIPLNVEQTILFPMTIHMASDGGEASEPDDFVSAGRRNFEACDVLRSRKKENIREERHALGNGTHVPKGFGRKHFFSFALFLLEHDTMFVRRRQSLRSARACSDGSARNSSNENERLSRGDKHGELLANKIAHDCQPSPRSG